jgi:hypothetical protein
MVQQTAKSTAKRIARVGGNILPGTAEWVPSSSIDSEGRLIGGRSLMQHRYRLGEVQSTMDSRRNFIGFGFNVLNELGAPIVTFAYVDKTDAAKAREQVKQTIANVTLIVAPGQ